MKHKQLLRIISFVLAFVMVLEFGATKVQANAIDVDSEAVKVSDERPVANIVGEEETLRGEGEKHFRLSDGSYIAVSYGMPVHYQDMNGVWQDIDNSMSLIVNDERSVYQTANNLSSTSFATDLTDGFLMSAEYDGHAVSMQLLDVQDVYDMALSAGTGIASTYSVIGQEETIEFNRASVANIMVNSATDIAVVWDKDDFSSWSTEEVLPEKLCSSILYEDVYPGIDLLYTAYSHNIKEQIVVRERQFAYTYYFLLEMDGLTATMNEDGSISLEDNTGNTIYKIPAPYMEDSAGMVSRDVSYELIEINGSVILVVDADDEWINSNERAFPVYVDPTLIAEVRRNSTSSSADIYATYVPEIDPDPINGGQQHLYLGYESTHKDHIVYLHIHDLPNIPHGASVVGASVNLCMDNYSKVGCNKLNVGIYEVTSSPPSDKTYWDWIYYMVWNNKASYNTGNMIDYATLKYDDYRYYSWDLTETAKEWYSEGTENRTVALAKTPGEKKYSSTYCALARFFAYHSKYPPVFVVSYRNNVGIEPYYTYATMGAGAAGTGYIADSTGQLKVAKEILSYASAVNPFTLNFVYNSDYFAADAKSDYQPPSQLGLNMKLGSGWTLDVVQKVEKKTISEVEYICYYDGDGTIHYFAKDKNKDSTGTFYYDEDGLGLKIKSTGSTTYEMSDEKDNKWIFANGYLKQIVDSNGNQYNIAYSNKQISSISQKNKGGSEVTVATIDYDGNYVKSIKDAAGNVFTFTRDGEKLTEILRNNTVIARYTYSNGQLIRLTDAESSYSLVYSYSQGKVSKYYEEASGTAGVYGEIIYPDYSQTVYIDYGADRTKDTSDDVLTYYLFDYAGRTANAYTTDHCGNVIGASNAVYSGSGSTDRTNNRTLRSATIGIAGQQLIRNSGFESTSSNAWTLNNASVSVTNPRSGAYSLKGTLSNTTATVSAAKASESLVENNTYTLSGFVNTCDISDVSGDGIYLKVSDSNNHSWVSKAVQYTTSANVDDGWVRISVTFTAKSSALHTIGVYGTGVIGTFYVDDLQLERGTAPSNRNMLENGNMQISDYAWSLGTDAEFTSEAGNHSSRSLKITGSPIDDATNAYQDVIVNLPGTQTYVLSGWVKANAVPDNDSSNEDAAKDLVKQCGLRAIIYYSENNQTENHYVPFNADLDEWQFTSLTIVPKEKTKTVSKIRVICAYEKNANIAYFDDISLMQEVAQTMKYDEDGNLVSTTTTGLQEDTDTYENGNLIKTVTGGNGTYTYTYDTTYKHRLISVSNSIVKQTLDYDASGNVVKTTLQGVSGGDSMVTSATYTNNGNLVESVTDMTQQTEEYAYGTPLSVMTGQATSVTDANGVTITSEYNSIGRVTEKEIANTISLQYNYASGLLEGVTRTDADGKSQTLSYSHDVFGNLNEIGIGGITLAKYTYGAKNGSLQKQTYGNGNYITFEYDNLQRTTKATYSSGRILTYTYTGDGQLHTITDNNFSNTTADDIVYCYTYDTLGRVIDCQVREGICVTLQVHWEYDDCNRVKSQGWQMGASSYKETYTYNATDGSLISVSIDDSGDELNMSYDSLQRLTNVATDVYSRAYSYTDVNDTQTTSQVNKIQYSGLNGLLGNLAYAYTYNSLGNIEKIQKNNYLADSFTYDNLGQLTYAYLPGEDLSFTYTYDTAGNLQIVQVHGSLHSYDDYTNTYVYGNSDWLDLLTVFNGQKIAYEGQTYNAETGDVSGTIVSGNPISYYNGTRWDFDWAEGRNLVSAGTSSDLEDIDIAYTYDSNGLRTSKTVTTEIYEYVHVHSYSDTVVEPTCIEGGYTLYECVCGDSYQGDEITALGHDYEESVSDECIVYTCTRCDHSYIGHTHTYVETVVSPTCTKVGYTLHECDCGYSYRTDQTDALGHNYVELLYQNKKRCTRCGDVQNAIVIPVQPKPPIQAMSYSAEAGDSGEYARVLVSTITEQHDYIYASGKLLRETITTTVDGVSTTETLDFRYDENGYPYSLTHICEDTATICFYITNLQGDVMYLVDANGNQVAYYEYDPYGKILSSGGEMSELNPLRYRGYYYDRETEFYYLQARYYDPATCRFINADTYSSTGQDFLGYNAFAYCGNNPVNRTDPDGEFWDTVFDIVSIGFSIADVVANPVDPWAWAGLAGDLVDLVPFVTGVGEATRAVSAMADAADVIDDIYDTAKFVENADDTIDFVDNVADAKKAAANLDRCADGVHCFVEGTLILTESGPQNIEDIDVGDYVWAANPETGELSLKCVLRLFRNYSSELCHIYILNEEYICTPEHPFYSVKDGWLKACELQSGDSILLLSGETAIVEHIYTEHLHEPVATYNFEVSDFHTYFIGEAGILVHNACGAYKIDYDDGTSYIGKGSKDRMNVSANQHTDGGVRKVVKKQWYPAASETESFILEAKMMYDNGFRSSTNRGNLLNLIQSPGYKKAIQAGKGYLVGVK